MPEPVRPVLEPDREAALAFLHRLVERDQLSLDHFSELVDTALRARNYDELTRMFATLPAPFPRTPPDQRSSEPLVVRAMSSAQDVRGSWHVPRRVVAKVNTGKVRFDFTSAVFDEPEVDLDLTVNTGVIELVVPAGMGVRILEGGGVRNQLDEAPALPGAPMLRIRARVNTGVVRIRRPQPAKATKQRRRWWRRKPIAIRP